MDFDWESLRLYVVFTLGMTLLLGASYKHLKYSGERV